MSKLWLIIVGIIAMLVLYAVFAKRSIYWDAPWINWGGNQRCNPENIFYPKNKQELINIVHNAGLKNHKIRAYGSAHAWSSIACSDYLINTDELNKVLDINKEKQEIVVEAGIKIYDLNEHLFKAGLALPNQSFTQAQSIAGAISTSTHGTGNTGTFSSFINKLELITADGQARVFTRDHDEFKAAATSIGNLGIIYSVTIQCVPAFKVKHNRTISDFKAISTQYKELNQKHDHFQFFWSPYTDKVLTYTWDKTDEAITPINNKLLKFKEKMLTGYWTGEFWFRVLDLFPLMYPTFIDILYTLLATAPRVAYSQDILSSAKKSNQEMIYMEEEIAIPIDSLVDAAHDVKLLMNDYKKRNFYGLVLFRFTNADTHSLLSMSSGKEGEHKVYISIVSAHINNNFYQDFGNILYKYKGRPHWGKINFLDYNKAHYLYGENLNKFIEIRKVLDPKNIFSNAYMDTILTPCS